MHSKMVGFHRIGQQKDTLDYYHTRGRITYRGLLLLPGLTHHVPLCLCALFSVGSTGLLLLIRFLENGR